MEVRRIDDPAAFLAAAGPLLLADEARNNLSLGIAGTLRDYPARYRDFRLWLVEDGGEVVGAALRTSPHNLVLPRPLQDGALAALAAAIDEELPGVVGALPEAEEFAALRPESPRTVKRQGIYACERVVPAAPAGGAMREAGESDLPLLADWVAAFAAEVQLGPAWDEAAVRAAAEHRLADPSAGFGIWEDGGPVSLSGYGAPTPNGIRISLVYTPPELRGRGYASALVAGLSAQLLAAGRRFCFLYTDLANPISNAIYRRIGYELVCESVELAFD